VISRPPPSPFSTFSPARAHHNPTRMTMTWSNDHCPLRRILGALRSLTTLQWSAQPLQLRPLPGHFERVFARTEYGHLKSLTSQPKRCSDVPPVFFAHGGYGNAGFWLESMDHLHHSGYSGLLYAYSFRNAGASFSVVFYNRVYRTSLESCTENRRACFEHAARRSVWRSGGYWTFIRRWTAAICPCARRH
jgi:pimeloyl-ACP methyl ester carboxylesterase